MLSGMRKCETSQCRRRRPRGAPLGRRRLASAAQRPACFAGHGRSLASCRTQRTRHPAQALSLAPGSPPEAATSLMEATTGLVLLSSWISLQGGRGGGAGAHEGVFRWLEIGMHACMEAVWCEEKG